MKNKTKKINWDVRLMKTKTINWYYSPTKNHYEHKDGFFLNVEEIEYKASLNWFINKVNRRELLIAHWEKTK